MVIYWGVGFNDSLETFMYMWVTLIMLSQVATALGMVISTACENMQSASAVSSLVTLPAILFGGLFVVDASVTHIIGWI